MTDPGSAEGGVRLYSTITKRREPLVPGEDGVVGVYVCGPTVYGRIHIGNARPFVVFSVLKRFLERRGEGMHHVAWAVDDVQQVLDALSCAGARVIDSSPRPGLHGTPVAFLHPASMGGVLVELVQVPAA